MEPADVTQPKSSEQIATVTRYTRANAVIMATKTPLSLTNHLLSLNPEAYHAATHAPFLRLAGQGRLPKRTLGYWLANDRLYLHAYLQAAARTLAALDLNTDTQLADWLIATLTALRREERLFIDVGRQYDLEMQGQIAKVPGLVMFEKIFASLHHSDQTVPMPWLEAAVVFWATERVYADAWAWAKSLQHQQQNPEEDADGGALRRELLQNWANEEFRGFVNDLGGLVDRAVVGREELVERAERVWRDVVAAEERFWPVMKLDDEGTNVIS